MTRKQIDKARSHLNGAEKVVDVLIRDGVVSATDVSRSLAAQAHMDWIDISSIVIPPEVIQQIRVLRDVFGLRVQAPLANGGAYIEYVWPLRRFVRDFSMFTPVECSADEKIAEFAGMAVCARRRIGKGGVIFLGSMLGPGLLAEEREAHELGSAMLQEIFSQRAARQVSQFVR